MSLSEEEESLHQTSPGLSQVLKERSWNGGRFAPEVAGAKAE
jgi:hypothetical protein